MLEFEFDPNTPDTTNGDFYCRVCLISSNSDTTWQSHLAGAKHIRRVGKGVKGLERRQRYKDMEKDVDEDSNLNGPEERLDDLSNSYGDYPYRSPNEFPYGDPRDYPYRNPDDMYLDDRMYDRDFIPGARPQYFPDSRDPLYNADSRGSFFKRDTYLPDDVPPRPILEYRDPRELPHSAIPKLVFDYSDKTVPSSDSSETPATSSVKVSVPLPEPPKPPFVTSDSQVDPANSLHPPAFLSQSAPFKEKDSPQSSNNSDPLQSFLKGLFNSEVPSESLTKLIDEAFSKTQSNETPKQVASNSSHNQCETGLSEKLPVTSTDKQTSVPNVQGDINSFKNVISNLFGQTNIDSSTLSFQKSLRDAFSQQMAYNAHVGQRNSGDSRKSLQMLLKDILGQNASNVKMSNQNLMNVIASAKAAFEDAYHRENLAEYRFNDKFEAQSKFNADSRSARDSFEDRRDRNVSSDGKRDNNFSDNRRDRNNSSRQNRDRDGSPRRNRDRGSSPSRNKTRDGSPRRYRDKSKSPGRGRDRSPKRDRSPRRDKDKNEPSSSKNTKKDLPKRYANADRDRNRDDLNRRRERDQSDENGKSDKNKEKFDPVQRYRRPEDLKLGKSKLSADLDVPVKKIKKVKLDEVDPDNLCPEDIDSLLSSFLKPKDVDVNGILAKVEILPTKPFLQCILKKLDNMELKDMEELNLLTQVIVKAQGVAYKKMPPRVQAAMMQKMSLSGNATTPAPLTGVSSAALAAPVGQIIPTPPILASSISNSSVSSTASAMQIHPAVSPAYVSNVSAASPLTFPPLRQTDQSLRQIEQPLRSVELPLRQIEQPLRSVELPLRQIEQPLRSVELPPRQIEQPLRQTEQPVCKTVSATSPSLSNSSVKQTVPGNVSGTSFPSTSAHQTQLPQVDQKKVLAAYSKLLQSYREKAGLPPDASIPNLDSSQMSKLLSIAITQSSMQALKPASPVSNNSKPKNARRSSSSSSSSSSSRSSSSSSGSSSSSSSSSSSDSPKKTTEKRETPPPPKPKLSFAFTTKKTNELPVSAPSSKEWKDFFTKR